MRPSLALAIDPAVIKRVVAGLRFDPSTLPRAEPPDYGRQEEILELVRNPFPNAKTALDRLGDLETLLRNEGDRRAIFLTVYVEITSAIEAQIADDQFRDSQWVNAYLTRFGNYYREAFLAFQEGRLAAVPLPWSVAFTTALTEENLAIQDALLGVNAHINYDLPFTLHKVGIRNNRSVKYDDHTQVNAILEAEMNDLQELLANHYMSWFDVIDDQLGSIDEQVGFLPVPQARELAWRHALGLTDARFNITEGLFRWSIQMTALGGAALLQQARSAIP